MPARSGSKARTIKDYGVADRDVMQVRFAALMRQDGARPPQHRLRRVEKAAVTEPAQEPATQLEVPVDLSADYYRRGILARRHADVQLSSIGDALDEVASRAERLLHQLALIVGEPTDS